VELSHAWFAIGVLTGVFIGMVLLSLFVIFGDD
jgi:hypothetical protein